MYVVEGYTHKEIGDILGISEGTSKSQLSRAKVILQDMVRNFIDKQRGVKVNKWAALSRIKCYNRGFGPPEAVWVSIASELDESAATHLLAAKLTNYTVTAPASIWEKD